jgi:hypothetical protein
MPHIIMPKQLAIVLLCLAVSASCNIWDNMYSQTYAKSPIILENSINLEFRIPQYSLIGNFDFNSQQSLLTVTASFDALITQMEVFKIQLDLATLTATTLGLNSPTCQRFQLEALANNQMNLTAASKSPLFLINLLFKFVGQGNYQGKKMDKYKFEPFLLGSPESQFDKAKEELEKNMEKEMENDLKDIDPNIDFLLYVWVDPLNGKIVRITEGENNNNVPFELASKVHSPMPCTTPIKVLTNDDLKTMLQDLTKNRDSYEKYIPKDLPIP